MFTLDNINKEIDSFNRYLACNIPYLSGFEYSNTEKYYGEIRKEEIINNNFIIHFSDRLNGCVLKYQKSIIWHECVHILDILKMKDKVGNDELGYMMSTYSEAHAKAIQIRFLLNLSQKQIVNQGTRYLPYVDNEKENLGTVTSSLANQSISSAKRFLETNKPNDFNQWINNFSYLCGYMMLKKKVDANKLMAHVIKLHPEKFHNDLRDLYQYILSENILGCKTTYLKLKTEGMIRGLPDFNISYLDNSIDII